MPGFTRWYISPLKIIDDDTPEQLLCPAIQEILMNNDLTKKERDAGERLSCVNYVKPGENWCISKVNALQRHHDLVQADIDTIQFEGSSIDDNADANLSTKTKNYLSGKSVTVSLTDTVKDVINKTILIHEPDADVDKTTVA